MWIEIILSAVILWILWKNLKKPSDYPPGIWGLPLIGSVPLSLQSFDDKFQKLKKKHGNIFCWRIGSRLIVFLCDFTTIKEAFQTITFADRPQMNLIKMIQDTRNIGLTASNGIHWHNVRRFTLRHLRDLGMGKSKMEFAVQYEAIEFVKELKKQAGTPVPITKTLKIAVINILWQLVASKRYAFDDPEIHEFDRLIHSIEKSFSKLIFRDIFPWITALVPNKFVDALTDKHITVELSKQLKQAFEVYIKDHLTTLDETNPRDFIDAYLIEMEKQKEDPDSLMSNDDLLICIADLFGAGFETTAATIYWSILYLTKFPEVQDKLQKELDNVLPGENIASVDDKLRLPYTEAFINEVLRYSSLTIFGLPRTVATDITLRGYTIPKDAIVVSTTQSLHFDPTYFDSPKEFRPERFLNSDGKFEQPKLGYFPFGIGKRQCMGESLARMELFIFITAIVKHVQFSPPPNKEVDMRPMDMPLFNQPRRDQDILITIRN